MNKVVLAMQGLDNKSCNSKTISLSLEKNQKKQLWQVCYLR